MITCKKCGLKMENESLANLHHLIPRCIGGKDIDGRKYLCKKCHDIIHLIIFKILWQFVPNENRENAKEDIKNFSLKWMGCIDDKNSITTSERGV